MIKLKPGSMLHGTYIIIIITIIIIVIIVIIVIVINFHPRCAVLPCYMI